MRRLVFAAASGFSENARERSKGGTQNAGTQLPQNAANAERRGTQQPWNAAERRAVAPRTQNSPERSRTQIPERSCRGTQRNAAAVERSGTQSGGAENAGSQNAAERSLASPGFCFCGFWLLAASRNLAPGCRGRWHPSRVPQAVVTFPLQAPAITYLNAAG